MAAGLCVVLCCVELPSRKLLYTTHRSQLFGEKFEFLLSLILVVAQFGRVLRVSVAPFLFISVHKDQSFCGNLAQNVL